MRVRIVFCVEWNYAPRAASLAEALVSEFRGVVGKGSALEAIELVPSGGGVFDVSADGQIVFSKHGVGRHGETAEMVRLVREHLA